MPEGFFTYPFPVPPFPLHAQPRAKEYAMERKYIPETENRLLILYALHRLGPMTGMQLLQLMVELDLMNYITLQLSLTDMEAQGQLHQQAHPGGSLYNMTDEGAFTLDSFVHRIPSSRRERIDQQGERFRERFRNEQLAPAESFPLPDDKTCIRLRLLEKNASLMDVLLFVPSASVPTLLQARWHACAQVVYEAVLAALMGGYSESLPMAPAPLQDALHRCDTGEWLLSLSDQPEQPSITLMLVLPGEHLARFCASRWQACCLSLRQSILTALEQAL